MGTTSIRRGRPTGAILAEDGTYTKGSSSGCTGSFGRASRGTQTLALFDAEVDEFEALLDCQVRIGARDNPRDAAWVVSPSGSGEPASLSWDPATRTLTSHASGPDQTMHSMQLLHALLRDPQDRPEFRAPRTTREAAQLIRDEVLGSYPYFDLRGIDRDQWAARHAQEAPEDWDAFTVWAQEWVAQVGDAHTAVIARSQRGFNPCYLGSLGGDGIMLEAVPEASAAHAACVRAGWLVTVEDPLQWLRTTGASPQQHARVAARRALTVTHEQRRFTAHAPNSGQKVSWTEVAAHPSHSRRSYRCRTPPPTSCVSGCRPSTPASGSRTCSTTCVGVRAGRR